MLGQREDWILDNISWVTEENSEKPSEEGDMLEEAPGPPC
jgi:hypothetical protein